MKVNNIIWSIKEELSEIELNDVIQATCFGFGRVNHEKEPIYLLLPKNDKEEREKTLRVIFDMLMQENLDEDSGKCVREAISGD